VYQYIAEGDDLAKIGDLLRHRGISPRQLRECFADDLELPFDRRSQNNVPLEIGEGLVGRNNDDHASGIVRVPQQAFRLTPQRRALASFDARLEIGIAHRGGLDEIDRAAQQILKGLLEAKIRLQGKRVGMTAIELDQEIDIASLRVEIAARPPSRRGRAVARGSGGTTPAIPCDAMRLRRSS